MTRIHQAWMIKDTTTKWFRNKPMFYKIEQRQERVFNQLEDETETVYYGRTVEISDADIFDHKDQADQMIKKANLSDVHAKRVDITYAEVD